MKLVNRIASAPYAASAALTVALFSAADAQAAESSTVGAMADTVKTQITNVGQLLVAGVFLAGVGLVAAGLMKLKQAADSQGQQVKYGEGLWRLAVGAGLVAVPVLTGVLSQTIGLGDATVTNSKGF